jgi:hypothetical protein
VIAPQRPLFYTDGQVSPASAATPARLSPTPVPRAGRGEDVVPGTAPRPIPGRGSEEPRASRALWGAGRAGGRVSTRAEGRGQRQDRGRGGGQCEDTPGRGGRGGRTFRRKLATTCSKGYLYTWRTSTVTPIPRGTPAPRRPAARGAWTSPPLSNFENFIVLSTDSRPRPRPFRQCPLEVARKALGSRGLVSFPVPFLATLQLVSLPRSHHSTPWKPWTLRLLFKPSLPGVTK